MQKVRIQTRHSLTRLVSVAMLSAVALVLYLLEFPLLPAATYLKMDFSDIPAVFGGVLFGPAYGVLIELIKNLLEMLLKGFGTQMGFGIHQLMSAHLWEMDTVSGEQFGEVAEGMPESNEDFTEHIVKIRQGIK